MPVQTVAAKFNEVRLASASTGLAATTTAQYVSLLPGTQWFSLTPRNFVTGVVIRWALNPYLIVIDTRDNLATIGLDASYLLQDGDNTVVLTLNSFSTGANSDYLYIGSHMPFRGVHVDVQNTNSTASVLTASYWAGGSWISLSATDNTASAGATLAADGTVTWTIPAGWREAALKDIVRDCKPYGEPYIRPQYWTRWEFSAAIDSTVSINQIRAIARSTAYDELISGETKEQSVDWGPGGMATIEALTDAGTANLIVQVATLRRSRFKPVAVA